MVVYFAGMLFIVYAARNAAPYVNDFFVNNTSVYSDIQERVTAEFADKYTDSDNSSVEAQNATINSYNLPDSIKGDLIINNTKEMYNQLLVSFFDEYVSAYLAKAAVKAISFLTAFVVLYVLFRIILVATDIITKIPIIKGLNKYMGAFIGFLEALLIVWIFFYVSIGLIGHGFGDELMSMVRASSFLTSLYNSNILLPLI